VKIEIGAAQPLSKDRTMEVKGRDAVSGFPKTIVITSQEIVNVFAQPLNQIAVAIKSVLEKTPPELASDVIDKGIVLSGGTALLRNLDKHISDYTGIAVHVAEDPLYCVVKGLSRVLENADMYSKSMIKR
jgi:rod shape-determining protein MreB and related proteins